VKIRDDITPIRASGQLTRLTPSSSNSSAAPKTPPETTHGATTPLYGWLKEQGLLDPANPPLRP
jgi:hypothetical protein